MRHGRQDRSGHPGTPGHQIGEQRQAAAGVHVTARAAQGVVVDEVTGGQRMQPRHRLQRRAAPHPDQCPLATFERLGHPQRAGKHRITAPIGGKLQRSAVEHRRGPGGAYRGLGRGLRPAAKIGTVPMGPTQRLARLVAGLLHTG